MSLKKIIKDYLPYSYMVERRKKQMMNILGEQEEPPIFDESGERKRVFFLKDTLSQHTPYTFVYGQYPKHILWDRHNVGLPIQFYTHESIFQCSNRYAKKKYAVLFESEVIRGADFEKALSHPEIMEKFDRIFTFSEGILNRYKNALFIPASGLWYGGKSGGELTEDRFENKTKNISVICSGKNSSEYHRIRQKLAKISVEEKYADGYGGFFGNYIKKKSDALDDYRYSIVVENDVKPYYFTEKIMDCFASMTVPVYVGAEKIGDYFNTDGIILVEKKDYDRIGDILKGCNEKDYIMRKNAIFDNFNRVKKFRCIEDYIYENYKTEFDI